jgi:hypothetical protein
MESLDKIRNDFEMILTDLVNNYKLLKSAGNYFKIQTEFVIVSSDIQIETLISFLQETDKDFTKSFIIYMIADNDCKHENVKKVANAFKSILINLKNDSKTSY